MGRVRSKMGVITEEDNIFGTLLPPESQVALGYKEEEQLLRWAEKWLLGGQHRLLQPDMML